MIFPRHLFIAQYRLLCTSGLILLALILIGGGKIAAANTVVDVCPSGGIQARGAQFTPGGIILTAFDKASMWVYNIDANRRYPLPDTRPCGTNCRLSPDAEWITYVDSITEAYSKMRLDGTERTPLIDYAADVEWWSTNILLVWTPAKDAYLQPESGGERDYLNVSGVANVQPGGKWGIKLKQDGDTFHRLMVNLEAGENIDLLRLGSMVTERAIFGLCRAGHSRWVNYYG
jgi:hypothetical protein